MYCDQVNIEDNTFQIQRVMRSYRDYRKDKDFWLEFFFNFIIVIFTTLGSIISLLLKLFPADFWRKIFGFAKINQLLKGVLLLVLNFYTNIVKSHSLKHS